MRSLRQYVRIAGWLAGYGGAVGGAAAEVLMPVRIADRPSTLAVHAARVDVDVGYARAPGDDGWSAMLGGGFGVTADLELGGQFVPLTLSPDAAVGDPMLYGAYTAMERGAWAVVPSLQVSTPLHDDSEWAVDAIVGVSWAPSPRIGVAVSPNLSVTFADPTALTVALPVQGSYQLDRRISVGGQVGFGFARFDPRSAATRVEDMFDLDEATAAAGLNATYTAGGDDRFVDLGIQLQWPALWTNGGIGFEPGDWNVLFTASAFRGR